MSGRMPPLNPLRVFEVAASLESFTKAARSLNISQSAVSRQVGVLEDFLGVKLFRREPRGAYLTAAGRLYYLEIGPALRRIAAATEDVVESEKAEPLRVRVYNTFAAKWLIPRLHDFHSEHPSIRIRLSHAVTPVDFTKENVDIAIQLGRTDRLRTHAQLLFHDVIQPVCSPDLLARGPGIEGIDDLFRFGFVHSHYRRRDWADWLEANGCHRTPDEGMTFPSSLLAYQAAIEGIGIGIGQLALLQQELAEGILVPLLDRPVTRDLGYYAVWPEERPLNRRGQAFVAWLRSQC